MYIALDTVEQTDEDIDKLPVIVVIDDGNKKYVSEGLGEVAKAIVEIVPYLGERHSELIPIAIEVWSFRENGGKGASNHRRKESGLSSPFEDTLTLERLLDAQNQI